MLDPQTPSQTTPTITSAPAPSNSPLPTHPATIPPRMRTENMPTVQGANQSTHWTWHGTGIDLLAELVAAIGDWQEGTVFDAALNSTRVLDSDLSCAL